MNIIVEFVYKKISGVQDCEFCLNLCLRAVIILCQHSKITVNLQGKGYILRKLVWCEVWTRSIFIWFQHPSLVPYLSQLTSQKFKLMVFPIIFDNRIRALTFPLHILWYIKPNKIHPNKKHALIINTFRCRGKSN